MKSISAADFVNAHKLHDRIFVTGLFYSGITIYNQQVRTLNLIYHLTDQKIIKEPKKKEGKEKIVIIGGGVSGVTAAIAFRKLGHDVSILEEKSILLHLQHGCSIRKIHPHLFLWPMENSLKSFTELPFANWIANDAAGVERSLIEEFEKTKDIEVSFNISQPTLEVEAQRISFETDAEKQKVEYTFLLIATGFGLEKYVGRREKAKSYWRNDDFGQLRIGEQINKFVVTGMGDGAAYDICRLTLIAFDPFTWAQFFQTVKTSEGNLIDDLRLIFNNAQNSDSLNIHKDFTVVYEKYKDAIDKKLNGSRRTDIKATLNGKLLFDDSQNFLKMSFLNSWLIFLLGTRNFFQYHKGDFPKECGEYLFMYNDNSEVIPIVRHGTEQNDKQFENLHPTFIDRITYIKSKQKEKRYNAFSTRQSWKLEFWQQIETGQYEVKRIVVSQKLTDIISIYLHTIEGLISNFYHSKFERQLDFRATMHRLIKHEDDILFQQLSQYTGTRYGSQEDIGRAFPINEGVVGLAMRTSEGFYMKGKAGGLFDYTKIFARPLPEYIKSQMVIPISSKLSKEYSFLALYIDTDEHELFSDKEFRKIIYWSLSSFVKKIDLLNTGESRLMGSIQTSEQKKKDLDNLNINEINTLSAEMKDFFDRGNLLLSKGTLVDIL